MGEILGSPAWVVRQIKERDDRIAELETAAKILRAATDILKRSCESKAKRIDKLEQALKPFARIYRKGDEKRYDDLVVERGVASDKNCIFQADITIAAQLLNKDCVMGRTAEQNARYMLERMKVKGALNFTNKDVQELADLIADRNEASTRIAELEAENAKLAAEVKRQIASYFHAVSKEGREEQERGSRFTEVND